jgi:hypothetical protein
MPNSALIKAAYFTQAPYLENKQFDCADPLLNRDDGICPFKNLRDEFLRRGVDLATQDINSTEAAEFVIYKDMPPRGAVLARRSYLLIFESELIRPDNWDLKRHPEFRRIFTWHDGFVDGRRYFKFNFPSDLALLTPLDGPRPKFAAMIAGRKRMRSATELYSKRVEAIRWFERHHPEDFDLFGGGWDDGLSLKRIAKSLLAFDPAAVIEGPFPSFRGRIPAKLDVLRRYKFSICFENVAGIPGYVTEKMLNCFQAGCVPVYWGAPNVADHIPAETFIDFRNFKDYAELYRFLSGMSERERGDYQDAIVRFMTGPAALQYGNEFFAEQIVGRFLEDHV